MKTYVDGHRELKTGALTQRPQKLVRKVKETCLAKEAKVFGTVNNGIVFPLLTYPIIKDFGAGNNGIVQPERGPHFELNF